MDTGHYIVAITQRVDRLLAITTSGGITTPNHINELLDIRQMLGETYQQMINENWATIKEVSREKRSSENNNS